MDVAAEFAIDEAVAGIDAFGSGHINDTWQVTGATGSRYVLQRINARVFADPAGVARNTSAVCRHVRNLIPALVPGVVPTSAGEAGLTTEAGVYRMMTFVAGAVGAPPLSKPAAHAAGAAFGRLQRCLADYDASRHVTPIPGFLELSGYLSAFDAALLRCDAQRRSRAAALIERVMMHRDHVSGETLGPEGMIHGDCKIDNLIFDDDRGEVRAIIDLDTVMWGRRAWDFGDLVRSGGARGAEDAQGLCLDLDLFRPIAAGFAGALGDLFDRESRAAFVEAPAYVAFMLATRFLTDFLSGDVYFKVADALQNLRRASAQLALFDSARDARGSIERILAQA